MSFPRYPKYKASGVEWLGSVPSHWTVARIKCSISSCRNGIWGDEPAGDADDIACVRVADFDRTRLVVRGAPTTIRNVSAAEREGRLLNRGDLLIEKSGGGELQPVGCVVLYDLDVSAVCSNFVAGIKLRAGFDSSFWRYVHAAAYAVRLTIGSINQTSGIQNLDQGRYFNERAPIPPPEEQKAIADFLDRETGKIDALMAEQEKLIELLKDKRRAVISHAVARGLNSDVPMKPSGIEWLGDVPAHWDVGPLKRFWFVTDCKHLTAEFVPDGVPLASIREVQSRYVCLEAAKRTTERFYEQLIEGGRQPLPGDLIFSRNATVGEVAQVPPSCERFAMGQDVCLLRRRHAAFSSDYMQYVIGSPAVFEQLNQLMIGSTFKRVNVEQIRALMVPCPPAREQQTIAAWLESELARLDDLTGEVGRSMGLLKERRSALISAAVTGQIDVRAFGGVATSASRTAVEDRGRCSSS